MLDSAIHRIKIYPVDNAIGFPNTYPLDKEINPMFEQPGPRYYCSCSSTELQETRA